MAKISYYKDGTAMPGRPTSHLDRAAIKIGSRPMSLCGQLYPRQINVLVESATVGKRK